MKQFVKFFAFLMTAVFLWSAYVQLNDPDAGVWIAIYLVAALGSLLAGLGRLPSWLGLLMGIAFAVGAFISWPETYEGVSFGEMEMANMNIERGRESIGLAITALVFFLYSWQARGKRIS